MSRVKGILEIIAKSSPNPVISHVSYCVKQKAVSKCRCGGMADTRDLKSLDE